MSYGGLPFGVTAGDSHGRWDGSPDRRYDASGRNGIYAGTPESRVLGRLAIACMVRHVGLKGLRPSNHINVQLFASEQSLQITSGLGSLASNRS